MPSPVATSTVSPLFRPEALDATQASHLGTIRIGTPPRFAVVAVVALLLAAALISYVTVGEVTRKARVPGLLMPVHGSLNVVAPQSGTVADLQVREGDDVRRGQVLMHLRLERTTLRGDAADLVGRALHSRAASLRAERQLAEAQARLRADGLADRLRGLRSEHRQAEGELEAVQRRVVLALRTADRYAQLASSGFVADLQAQEKQELLVELQLRERSAKRLLAALDRDIGTVEAEHQAVDLGLRSQLAQLDRSLAQLDQEATENEARSALAVTAPSEGVVTAMTLHAGQAVAAGQTLAVVVPRSSGEPGSTLEAHLYATSRTIGFVAAGQQVWLRYAAYPYQKFGMAPGRVRAVSRTPLAAGDLPIGQSQALAQAARSNEPLYRIVVEVLRPVVRAYGHDQPLRAGMALEADVVQDRRPIWEWLLDPVLAGTARWLDVAP